MFKSNDGNVAPVDDDYAIEVNNVSKSFRIPHEKRTTVYDNLIGKITGKSCSYEIFEALKDVSFKVKKGETLGIIGENGSGKSTLLKILTGVLVSDTGSVKVRGKVAPFLELGVGFQPELTAVENVYLYGAIMGMKRKEMDTKLDSIFEFAELDRFRDAKLKNFSSGMYARLAFATAISTDPDVLLLDEVLSVGDESFQKKCNDKMDEYRRNGKTIVFVSHSLGTVEEICERSILLDKGLVKSEGYSEKVIYDYHVNLLKKEEGDLQRQHEKTIEQMKVKQEEIAQVSSIDNTQVEIEEKQPDRWGSREIEITDVKFFDKNCDEKYVFKTGEKLIVQIKYYAKKPIYNPTFGVAIYKNDGTYVYGSNTRVDQLSFGQIDGEGTITLTYDNLNLLNGTFLIDVAIYDQHFIVTYDYLKHNYYFKVQDDTGNEGICKIVHQYKMMK